MQIDAATRRNLELVTTTSGERRGSLLATIDRTVTGAGARLLADHLAAPLTEPAAIAARLDAVGFFLDAADIRARLRERLRHCPDIERALTRLSLGRGGPRDLAALRESLGETAVIRDMLADPASCRCPRCWPRRGAGSASMARWSTGSRARSPPNCRSSPATAVLSPPAIPTNSTSCASCATRAGA